MHLLKTFSESYKFEHTYTFGVVPFVLEIKIIKQLAFTIKSSAQISPLGSRLSRGETSLISSLVAISDFMQFEIGHEIHNFKEIMAYFDLVFRVQDFLEKMNLGNKIFDPRFPRPKRQKNQL